MTVPCEGQEPLDSDEFTHLVQIILFGKQGCGK